MSGLWIVVSRSWSLEDVQAVLNVVISFLSALAIWTFSRFCWQQASTPVTKTHNILLLSLFSISSLGDVFDVLQLLKTSAISPRKRPRILAQVVVVSLFSFAAILSGPIARHASRIGNEVTTISQTGLMAITTQEQGQEKIRSALVEWNQTQISLQKAGFPTDQLLDYLPDPSYHWFYRADEWNASWVAQCNFTHETPIHLIASGNRSDTEIFTQVPAFAEAAPTRFLNRSVYIEIYDICGFEENRSTYKDLLFWILRYPDTSVVADYGRGKRRLKKKDSTANLDEAMAFSITAFHLHDAPRPSDMDGDDITFGTGSIGNASYTRTDCDLARSRPPPEELRYAYPDTLMPSSIVSAYADYYRAGVVQQSVANNSANIHPPSPEELFQFYQVYMVTKDTQHQHPVERPITVEVPVVQLSSIFLAVALLIALLIVVGVVRYTVFLRGRHEPVKYVPDTKLDWMLHAMKEAGGSSSSHFTARKRDLRYQLETAMYGSFEPLSQKVGPMKVQLGISAEQKVEVVHTPQPKGT
jgi:hypothetical protein